MIYTVEMTSAALDPGPPGRIAFNGQVMDDTGATTGAIAVYIAFAAFSNRSTLRQSVIAQALAQWDAAFPGQPVDLSADSVYTLGLDLTDPLLAGPYMLEA